MIRLLPIILTSVVCFYAHGQQVSWHPFASEDSLIIQSTDDGSLFLTWRAGSQTTLSTIMEATGYTSAQLHEINPILNFRNIERHDLILVPLDRNMIDVTTAGSGYPLLYKVRQGETLFGIAKRTLQVPADSLAHFNSLGEAGVRMGQILFIGRLKKLLPVVAASSAPSNTTPVLRTDLPLLSADKKYATQKGVAWWNKEKLDPNMFVLHRFAPLNSVLEIRNPMFGRCVRAKVIGTIPPTYTEDIAIIVSQGVAKSLGALDGRFYVEVTYEIR